MGDKQAVLVVGGGSGMGADAAKRLADEGFDVAVMSSSGKGEQLAKLLGGYGMTESHLEPADLQAFVDGALNRFGRIDAVVNSTGHGPKGPVLEISDDWHLGMDYYFLNVARMCRLVTPHMLKNGGGSIVNISTYAAFEPEELFPTSGVFRSALVAYTKLYTDKYASVGIRMNNVLPGFIDSLPEATERRERIPKGRYGKVAEVSELVCFLASARFSYMIGQNIRIDGGITRSV